MELAKVRMPGGFSFIQEDSFGVVTTSSSFGEMIHPQESHNSRSLFSSAIISSSDNLANFDGCGSVFFPYLMKLLLTVLIFVHHTSFIEKGKAIVRSKLFVFYLRLTCLQ